jgi:2-polyprenyl-6-hydroxyphenyl methylase/3-demethylubiquinone-9 3-methyltransferase
MQATAPGVSAAEIAKFDALAATWWDRSGPMRELHRMNPLRTGWVHQRIVRRFGSGGTRLLDVGCGAGIAAEAFARLGHDVLGVDAAAEAIAAARAHAAAHGVPVEYRVALADALRAEGRRFQVITALEVIEHVPDPGAFVATLAGLLEPGGLLFVSTLSRTARSYALAIVGAEMVARLVPRGTHDWRRFVTPAELAARMRAAGLLMTDSTGMVPDPLAGGWRASRDTSVNYIAMAEAGGRGPARPPA